ncbi:MAG TPA: hypothetical protein VFO95_08595 [Gemmatimonadales bacterium]|nr:hypothetical protein [Gemmatimonadales bacterium]
MSGRDSDTILREVISGTLDPIAAADELVAAGELPIGGLGVDLGMVEPEQALRLQALMGRLFWRMLNDAGAVGLPEPDGIEGYREFLAQNMGGDTDDDVQDDE